MENLPPRKRYSTDVTDEEWVFVPSYVTLMDPDASERRHYLRKALLALRLVVRAGSPWRMLLTKFPL